MQTYDWRRFARLLRIDRPDCWDREDAHRLPWVRGCPYRLETDGVYLPDLPLSQAPPGLWQAEIEALHPGDGGKVLTLPATLPAIIGFLDSSGEYARLPDRLWPRLQRLAAKAAAFSQAWEELDSRAIPFDSKAARKERFIPLKVLLSWLEPLPAPGDSVPELELFALAKRHIQVGHLKTHGPSWRYVPETFDQAPETIDVRVDGEVIGQVTRSADLMPLPDDPESPLIDVLEFAAWFREVCPAYLRLPAGFPGNEVGAGAAASVVPEEAPVRAELVTGAADPEPAGELSEPDWLTFKDLAPAFRWLLAGKSGFTAADLAQRWGCEQADIEHLFQTKQIPTVARIVAEETPGKRRWRIYGFTQEQLDQWLEPPAEREEDDSDGTYYSYSKGNGWLAAPNELMRLEDECPEDEFVKLFVINPGETEDEAREREWREIDAKGGWEPVVYRADVEAFEKSFIEAGREHGLPVDYEPSAIPKAGLDGRTPVTPAFLKSPDRAGGEGPEPAWLVLEELAAAFQGLHGWEEDDWLRNFQSNYSPWITGAIRRVGKQGRGGRNTGNPVILAMNLIGMEARSGTKVADLVRQLNERFERPPLLEWRAVWRREGAALIQNL